MRILVISDSHKRFNAIHEAIEAQPDAKHVFFLGDILADIENFEHFYPDRIFHLVSGNCDFGSELPTTATITLENKKILYTHGHAFGVKHGLEQLLSYAKARGADIAFYGHTHVANIEYADGIYLVNPGSIGNSREGRCSYAVIDIVSGQIMPIVIKV